jgi:hypothetical protein
VQCFLDASEDERVAIVTRLKVLSDDDDPVEALRALLKPTVPPEMIDLLCQAAIGMAKERAERLIRDSKPALMVRRHGLICGEISDLYAAKDAPVRGRLAYRRCAQLPAPLDARSVPLGSHNPGCSMFRYG